MDDAETLTLARLNGASHKDFVALLDGIYEHSPWIAERAWPRGPFRSLAHLKHALVEVVREAERDEQLALIRAHPELAGKAMVGEHAHGRVDQRAGQGRPHRLHAGRVRDASSSSTPPTTRSSASRSSSRCAGRAARA